MDVTLLQNRLVLSRYIAYIAVQMSGLIVPLLVYALTHNMALAGAALLIEWVPKMAFYLLGGSFVQRFSEKKAHIVLDLARLVGLSVLLLSSFHVGSVWLVAVAAGMFQAANAVSNILYEIAITRWWHEDGHAHGHTRMIKSDLLGCILALGVSYVLTDVRWLCLFALAVQLVSMAITFPWLNRFYPTAPHAEAPHRILSQVRRDLKAVCCAPLLTLSLSAALLRLPAAVMFSLPVFYLHHAAPERGDMTQLLSFVLLARSLIGAATLELVQRQLQRGLNEELLAFGGGALLLASTVMALCVHNLWAAVVAMIGIMTGSLLYSPCLRQMRQRIIMAEVAPESRSGATGVLISMEASSNILVAVFTALVAHNMTAMLLFAGSFSLVGMVWLWLPRWMAQREADAIYEA